MYIGRVWLSRIPPHVDVCSPQLAVPAVPGHVPLEAFAVWAYVVPTGKMQYPVVLLQGSWNRFKVLLLPSLALYFGKRLVAREL